MSEEAANDGKYWYAADFLIAVTYLSFFYVSSFIGSWGLLQNPMHELKVFAGAFLGYVIARTLPLPWALGVWGAYVGLLVFLGSFPNFYTYTFGYFLGLGFAILLLKNKRWPFWVLAPVAVHSAGLIYLFCFGLLNGETTNSLWQKVFSLSGHSLPIELLTIYPLLWLADQLNKLFVWFRLLE
jgi:hypothetical protein